MRRIGITIPIRRPQHRSESRHPTVSNMAVVAAVVGTLWTSGLNTMIITTTKLRILPLMAITIATIKAEGMNHHPTMDTTSISTTTSNTSVTCSSTISRITCIASRRVQDTTITITDRRSSDNKAPPPPPQQSLGPPPQSSKYYHTTLPDIPTLVESDASDLEEDSDDPKHLGSWGGQRSATRGGPKPPPSTAVTHAKKPPPTPPPPPPRRPSSLSDTGGEAPNLLEKVATLKYVEVAPGVHVRLRGADETWRSIENDFYMPTQCLPCGLTVFCIQDADFVICPDCRVVSPMMMVMMEGGEERSNYCEGKSDGGVGLGFTMEDLAAWQEDIERQRRIIPR